MKRTLPRRTFLNKLLLLLLLLPLWLLWDSEVFRSYLFSKKEFSLKLPANLPQGISFFDRVIIVKKDEQIKVFSSHCSHLGCIINKSENGVLVCPCHGSRYSVDGEVISGPAAKPLERLEFSFNNKTGILSVKV